MKLGLDVDAKQLTRRVSNDDDDDQRAGQLLRKKGSSIRLKGTKIEYPL